MKLTQTEGARLMAAHDRAGELRALYTKAVVRTKAVTPNLRREYEAAEQRFAALVASLTESEGL
jgi:hypothetical protein